MTRICRLPVPLGRPFRVARDVGASQEKRGDIDLGSGNALLGGLSKPFRGLAELLRDAVAARIEPPEAELRLGNAGFGGGPIPFCLDHIRLIRSKNGLGPSPADRHRVPQHLHRWYR